MRTPAPDSIALLAPGTPVERRRGAGDAGAPRRRPADRRRSSPVSTENAAIHLRPASEHAGGGEPVRGEPAGDPRQRRPAGRAADAAPSTRPTRSRGRRRSARTTTSSRPGRRSARKASRSAGAATSATWSRAATRNAAFTSISVSGNAVFSAGDTVFQYQVGNNGAVAIGGISGTLFGSIDGLDDAARRSSPPTTSICSPRSTRRSSTLDHRAGGFQTAFAASTVAGADATTSSRRPATRSTTASRSSCRPSPASSARAARSAPSARSSSSRWAASTPTTPRTRARPTCWPASRTRSATSTPCSRRRRRRPAQQRDAVHRLGLRPHAHHQRRRHRPRLGRPSLRLGGAVNGGEIYGRFPDFGLNNNQDSANNAYLPVDLGRHDRQHARQAGSASATPTSTPCSRTCRTSRATSAS